LKSLLLILIFMLISVPKEMCIKKATKEIMIKKNSFYLQICLLHLLYLQKKILVWNKSEKIIDKKLVLYSNKKIMKLFCSTKFDLTKKIYL
jgi:hypothetical protein